MIMASVKSHSSIIKYEMFHGKKFNSVNEFASALFSYCAWYNMYRPQTGLGGLTPLEKKTVLEREFYAHKNLNKSGSISAA